MQRLVFFLMSSSFIALAANSQQSHPGTDTTAIVFENERMIVTSYASNPGKDACGKGMHSHPPHLTIFLTNAFVKLTTKEGKKLNFDFKAGSTLWSEADTHAAINAGNQPMKVYLVEVK